MQHQHPQQVVHISSNAGLGLDELFNSVVVPSGSDGQPNNPHHHQHSSPHHHSHHHQSVPMRKRNLPASFFRPPSSASSSAAHSRESSLDATSTSSSSTPASSSAATTSNNSPLQAFSPKSNQTVSSKPPTPIINANPNGAATTNTSTSPLSPSSPTQVTQLQGQHSNHLTHQKSHPHHHLPPGLLIIHPRARSLPASLQQFSCSPSSNGPSNLIPSDQIAHLQQQQQQSQRQQTKQVHSQTITPNSTVAHFRQHSYDINNIQFPDGWEMSYTSNGDRYFLNHKQKITTWEDPRYEILKQQFQMNPNLVAQISQPAQQVQADGHQPPLPTYSSQPNIQQMITSQSSRQHQASASSSSSLQVDSNFDLSTIPLADGWDQANTINGILYYINHNDQTTSWYHPGLPRQCQQQIVQQKQINFGSTTPPSYPYHHQQQTIQQSIQSINNNNNNNNNNNITPELLAALENMNTSGQNDSSVALTDQINQLQSIQNNVNNNNANNSNNDVTNNNNNNNTALQEMESERKRYRQRQEELLNSQLLRGVQSSSDPFLSSAIHHHQHHSPQSQHLVSNHHHHHQLQHNHHVRGESVDSGLNAGAFSSHNNSLHGFGGSHLNLNHCALPLGGTTTPAGISPNDILIMNNHLLQPQPQPQLDYNPNNLSGCSQLVSLSQLQQLQLNPNRMSIHNNHNIENDLSAGMIDDDICLDNLQMDNFVSADSLDMDILNDVEELLNTNKDNLMTWL